MSIRTTLRNVFCTSTSIALCVVISAQLLGMRQASAGDRKHATSTICQGMTKAGRDLLKYNGSSLEAVGADVTVMCPIIRDNTVGKMRFIEVRFKRKNGDSSEVKGKVISCNSAFGGCESRSASTSSINVFTSTNIDTRNLPHSIDHYFSYEAILPDGWKIVSVEWDED